MMHTVNESVLYSLIQPDFRDLGDDEYLASGG